MCNTQKEVELNRQLSNSEAIEMEELIPGLPEEMARECLIRVPFDGFPAVRRVCRNWKRELDSADFHRLRTSVGLTRPVVAFAQAEPAVASDGPAKKYAASGPTYRLVLFEPVTGRWSCLPPVPWLPCGLPLFCQLASVGTELVVVGGWDPESLAASDGVHVYDFMSASWRRGAPMPGPRRSFFACAPAPELRAVFVAGGHDEEKNALRSAMAYDVGRDAWAALPDMARERDECRGVCVRGRFHVMGGYATESQGRFSNTAEAFDAAAWRWDPVEDGKLEDGACPRTCVAGGDGRLYMCRAGGEVVAMDEDGRAWRSVSELPEDARVSPQLVAYGRSLMVMGSENHGSGQTGYVLEEIPDAKDGKTATARRVAVPEEFAGHVQAGCYMEL